MHARLCRFTYVTVCACACVNLCVLVYVCVKARAQILRLHIPVAIAYLRHARTHTSDLADLPHNLPNPNLPKPCVLDT